jgi:hypothetical protein
MCAHPRKPHRHESQLRYASAPIPPTGYYWATSDLSTGCVELRFLDFTKMDVLCRLTFRVTSCRHLFHLSGPHPLCAQLSTIISPNFCELVLEFCTPDPPLDRRPQESWDIRNDLDSLLEEKFARNGDFRLTIRTSEHCDREELQRQAGCAFPLLASRGRIYLETL